MTKAIAKLPTDVFSVGDARQAGIRYDDIRTAVRNGSLRHVRRGVFTSAVREDEGRHQTRDALGALIKQRESGAVVSHWSAAAIWGIATLGEFGTDVCLTVNSTKKFRHYPGVITKAATLLPADVADFENVPITTPARTCVDLGRTFGPEAGLVAADSALHLDLTTPDLLDDAIKRSRGWPGINSARTAIRNASGLRESPGESKSWWFFLSHGISLPMMQAKIFDTMGLVGRVDFLWDDRSLVGEFDGAFKYAQDAGALYKEKQREDRLRALGFGVVRWTWPDLFGRRSDQLAARLRVALA